DREVAPDFRSGAWPLERGDRPGGASLPAFPAIEPSRRRYAAPAAAAASISTLAPPCDANARQGPGGQLEHTARALDPRRGPMRLQRVDDAQHAAGVVEEDDVDCVAHAEHVDLVRGFDPEAVAGFEAAGAEEAAKARPVGVGGTEALGKEAA